MNAASFIPIVEIRFETGTVTRMGDAQTRQEPNKRSSGSPHRVSPSSRPHISVKLRQTPSLSGLFKKKKNNESENLFTGLLNTNQDLQFITFKIYNNKIFFVLKLIYF